MKFIIWTLVWFGLQEVSISNEFLMGHTYSSDVRALAGVTVLFLWIFCYKVFINKEVA